METIKFFDLQTRLYEYKCDVYDWFFHSKHFEKWLKKKKLKYYHKAEMPRKQEIFAEYQRVSDGRTASPPYFNFWHFVLEIAKSKYPTDSSDMIVVIDTSIIPESVIYTDEMRAQYIERILNANVDLINMSNVKIYCDAVADQVDQIISINEAKHQGCKAAVEKIYEIYGGPIAVKLELGN